MRRNVLEEDAAARLVVALDVAHRGLDCGQQLRLALVRRERVAACVHTCV